MRRSLLKAIGVAVATGAACGISFPVHANEAYPTRPIRLLVGYAAGGTADLSMRYLADEAGKLLGQPIAVVNKPGASGALALSELKHAQPDGYTIGFLATGTLINAHMAKLPVDPVSDLAPILQTGAVLYGLAVQNDSPFKTLDDLLRYARANPGRVTYTTSGAGSPQHLVMLQLAQMAQVELTHVPTKGGVPAVQELLGGHVTATSQTTEWRPFVEQGRLRLLAIYSASRAAELPDVPTLVDLGWNIVAPSLYSIVGTKGTPDARLKKLHDTFHAIMQRPAFAERMKQLDIRPVYAGPSELEKTMREIHDTSGQIIRTLNVK